MDDSREWTTEQVDRLYAEIGENVRYARVRSGMTQTELSRIVGLSRSSIANLEAGRQRAPLHVLFQVAEGMSVQPVELIGTPATQSPEPDNALDTEIENVGDMLTITAYGVKAVRMLAERIGGDTT